MMKSLAGPGFFHVELAYPERVLSSADAFCAAPTAMRSFFRSHWKVIVAIVLLVLLALVTVNPGAATPDLALTMRLRAHVAAFTGSAQQADTRARRTDTAAYVTGALRAAGYHVHRAGGDIEVALANVAAGTKPERSFVIGARVDPDSFIHAGIAVGDEVRAIDIDPAARDDTGGAAVVLELARLLKDLQPSSGTEVRFVFFVDRSGTGGPPGGGSFIAYAGTPASARRVQDALAAFQGAADVTGHGLAAPAYLQGVTLSDRAGVGPGPVMMVTDTGFTRYPYHQVGEAIGQDGRDERDYEDMARVVGALTRTIVALAAGQQG
jgi:hypothetical protein